MEGHSNAPASVIPGGRTGNRARQSDLVRVYGEGTPLSARCAGSAWRSHPAG